MKESPLRVNSAPTAGQRSLTRMQQQNPVRRALIFQSGFCAVTALASASSTKTAFAVNAESHIRGKESSFVMYELKVITDFSAAHQLKNFRGACENLHGHNWRIEVYVTSDTLNEAGVAIDFRTLKKHVKDVVGTLDHKFLNDLEPFRNQNPSSENIAKYVAEQLALLLQTPDVKVSRVTAWESENACATYYA
jgi:6-pyruvoyltetrahydropterin/6-carboxytetrahydropterin synthase